MRLAKYFEGKCFFIWGLKLILKIRVYKRWAGAPIKQTDSWEFWEKRLLEK